MRPVFVESTVDLADLPAVAEARPEEFAKSGGRRTLEAGTRVAARRRGPFAPFLDALEQSHAVRAAFALGLGSPTLARWRWARVVLLVLAIAPLAYMVEIDRELIPLLDGMAVRLVVDAFLLAMVVADLVQRVPRFPWTTALILFAAGARCLSFISRVCGKTDAPLYAAGIGAIAIGAAVLALAPTRARLRREILDRVRLAPGEPPAAAEPPPTYATIAASLVVAAGLPVMLYIASSANVGATTQAILFAAYAIVVPPLIELAFERKIRWPRGRPLRVAAVVAFAFAFTHSVTDGARYAVDASAYAVRCVSPAAFNEGAAKKLLESQHREVTRNVKRDKESWSLFLLSVLIVPLVEERVYRGLLQRVLAARWGSWKAIAASAVIFGLAHLGVYSWAVYQAALLGLSFGVAYAEGGIWAAVLVHAIWNFHVLL